MPTLYKRGPLDSSRVLFLPVDSIQPNPYQPRQSFAQEDLDGLASPFRPWGCSSPSPSAGELRAGSWWPANAACGPHVWPDWTRFPASPFRWTAR